jgi:hypothetical protein
MLITHRCSADAPGTSSGAEESRAWSTPDDEMIACQRLVWSGCVPAT